MTDDKPDLSLVPNGGFVLPDERAKKAAAYQTDPKWAAKLLAEDVQSEPAEPFTGVSG